MLRTFPFGCDEAHFTGPDAAGSLVVLDVVGDLTDPSGELLPRVQSLMEQGEQAIIVNLAQITGWNHKGFGEIIRCLTTVHRRGRWFEVINAPPRLSALVATIKVL